MDSKTQSQAGSAPKAPNQQGSNAPPDVDIPTGRDLAEKIDTLAAEKAAAMEAEAKVREYNKDLEKKLAAFTENYKVSNKDLDEFMVKEFKKANEIKEEDQVPTDFQKFKDSVVGVPERGHILKLIKNFMETSKEKARLEKENKALMTQKDNVARKLNSIEKRANIGDVVGSNGKPVPLGAYTPPADTTIRGGNLRRPQSRNQAPQVLKPNQTSMVPVANSYKHSWETDEEEEEEHEKQIPNNQPRSKVQPVGLSSANSSKKRPAVPTSENGAFSGKDYFDELDDQKPKKRVRLAEQAYWEDNYGEIPEQVALSYDAHVGALQGMPAVRDYIYKVPNLADGVYEHRSEVEIRKQFPGSEGSTLDYKKYAETLDKSPTGQSYGYLEMSNETY
jgi:hypothetical protein